MANITDQFVTSFSELYIGDKTALGVVDYDMASNVRDFFTGGSDTEVELIFATAASVGDIVFLNVDGGKVYFRITTAVLVGTFASATDLTSTSLLAFGAVFLSAQVPLVMEIGSLSNEATVIDTPTFGEVFKGKLRGQLDGGQLDAQLYWAPRNFVHKLMRDYAQDGTEIVAGIKWKTAASGGDSEYVVFDSFVSSFGIDTTFDDVAKVSSTLVVDGAEYFASEE